MNVPNSIFNHVQAHTQTNSQLISIQNSNAQLCQENMVLRREIQELLAKTTNLEEKILEEKRKKMKMENEMQTEISRLKEKLARFTYSPYQSQNNNYHLDTYQPNLNGITVQQPTFWSQQQDLMSIQNPSSSNSINEFFIVNPTISTQENELKQKIKELEDQLFRIRSPQKQQLSKSTQYAVVFPCNKCIARSKFTSSQVKSKSKSKKNKKKIKLGVKTPPNTETTTQSKITISEEPNPTTSEELHADPNQNEDRDSDPEYHLSEEKGGGKIVRLSKNRLTLILNSSDKLNKTKHGKSRMKKKKPIEKSDNNPVEKPPKPPLKCSFCDKIFKKKERVKEHERCHTGEKPYSCNFCEKTFRSYNHMKKHVRIHTGEKPYRVDQKKSKFCKFYHIFRFF